MYLTSFNVQWFPAEVFMKTSPFPSISKSWLLARYTFSKFSDLKFGNSSLFGDEWKDAPESKILDSVRLSTLRIRESPMSYAEFIESSSSSNLCFCFVFCLVETVQKWHFSPQFQHVMFDLFGKFSWFDFYRSLFKPFNLLLPLWSTLRAPLDESLISRLWILSLRATSWISATLASQSLRTIDRSNNSIPRLG